MKKYSHLLIIIFVNCVFSAPNQIIPQTINEKFKLPLRYSPDPTWVWLEFIRQSQLYNTVDLGASFTNYAVPAFVTDALATAAQNRTVGLQQFARNDGHPRLVEALSKTYEQLIDRKLDPYNELLITAGSYQAINLAMNAHLDVGDEVIIVEPLFTLYQEMVKVIGGAHRYIQLKPNPNVAGQKLSSSDWLLDFDELESLFNVKTKMIIINSPHNPTGKIFSRTELERISDLCKQWNVIVLADEQLEWMVYDNEEHIRISTLPGMWERTITLGSVSSTFSLTGWRLGWAFGPTNLLENMRIVMRNTLWTLPTPIQEAVAIAFETEQNLAAEGKSYLKTIAAELQPKRDYLVNSLLAAGMQVTVPQAGILILSNFRNSPVISRKKLSPQIGTWDFSNWMIENEGIQGTPVNVMYSNAHQSMGDDYLQFCFYKDDTTLENAASILESWA